MRLVEELAAAKADINAKDRQGMSPLLNAVRNAVFSGENDSSIDVVKFLLAHGADLNARNSEGKTPLDLAEIRGTGKVAQLLVQAGANK
jgi:ankyrin repeat protein